MWRLLIELSVSLDVKEKDRGAQLKSDGWMPISEASSIYAVVYVKENNATGGPPGLIYEH
jgi:hypothetical protein